MSVDKRQSDRGLFNWIYRVSNAAARAKFSFTVLFSYSQEFIQQTVSGNFDI